MDRIITVTLNPAIDIHINAASLTVGQSNGATLVRRDSGGKGINVTRTLKNNGIASYPFTVVGRDNGGEYLEELDKIDIQPRVKFIDGAVRENINIHTPECDTVITVDGPPVPDDVIDSLFAELIDTCDSGDFVVFSGRISKATDIERVVGYLAILRGKGVRLICDSASLTLSHIERIKPHMIKPNKDELCKLIGRQCDTADSVIKSLMELVSLGCETVLLTLGADGAALATEGELYYATSPKIDSISTTGAGDSAVAGYICAFLKRLTPFHTLATATAFGSAACLAEGTLPPDPCEIKRLYPKVKVIKIKTESK